MSTASGALATIVVLALAGLMPAVALAGLRLVTVPLVPLAGAVVAALAATGYMAAGGTFIGWFVGLAAVGVVAVAAIWWRWPGVRPDLGIVRSPGRGDVAVRLVAVVGALAILVACVWCLRGLATPTVGFDARAIWLTRAGWFLQSHHQLLIKMRVPNVGLIQSSYPPLVSAVTAVAWKLTGGQSMRVGVVVIALLNTCALGAAALAIVDAGRNCTVGLTAGRDSAGNVRSDDGRLRLAPMVVAVAVAVLVVFIAFGITEPFMTNGYADPIWSLAAVGAVAYGLQLPSARSNAGVAAILVVVAGMSKNEGLVTAGALIALMALRSLAVMDADDRRSRWWRPLLAAVGELVAIAIWPVVMRAIGARGDSTTFSSSDDMVDRARSAYHGMAPYLHVVVLAVPVAVVGGLVLSRVRRRSGVANDCWAWAALASGLLAVGGAFVIGTGTIAPWLETTVHRVTEFGALAGWWIVAVWAVVASTAPAVALLRRDGTATDVAPTDPATDRSLSPAAAVGE
jgi:hypothetical protein